MNDLPVLYEDASVVVVNKPAGLIVHSDGRTVEPSVADWVAGRYPDTRTVGEPWMSPQGTLVPRPGIVHRLDRTTSGVLVIAKTAEAYASLKKQFQDRTVEKEYAAIVYGTVRDDRGRIEREIVRVKSVPPRWGVSFGTENKKRAAVTDWAVLRRFSIAGEPYTLLSVCPRTGRTHQIRVHLKALGHPIVCDHLYAAQKSCPSGLSRPGLHAYRITFTTLSGERRTVEAPPPADLGFAYEA
ncbi:RluA family pseudouridine synthase [Patescibacteria group bacterium]|nr:RluA family pseudouridine synthase [Patescibacteria group bacterium]